MADLPESEPVPPAEHREPLASNQSLVDLLTLGALACRVPAAVLAVGRQGQWSTLRYGLVEEEEAELDPLFETVADSMRPMEFRDLAGDWPGSALVGPAHGFRWAFGLNLRDRTGEPIGVVIVFDQVLHEMTGAEDRALAAVARRMVHALTSKPRVSESAVRETVRLAPAPSEPRLLNPRMGGRDSLAQPLLKSSDVAAQFDVTERTVINWVNSGKLPAIRTVGGHLRFRKADIWALIADAQRDRPEPD